MKPALTLVLMLALAGCSSGNTEQKRGGKHTEEERAAAMAAADGENSASADVTVAPSSVPESYGTFPPEVRTSIYRWDLLNQKCSGRFRTKAAGACEEREALTRELLTKGWCFGGADDPDAQHWVLCAQDYPGGEGYIASPDKQDPTADQ